MGTSATPGKQIASANSEQEGAIEVRNLVKRYPKAVVNAVDNISFTVGRGEIFGLLGPNGAGKTTTIGVLTTNVRPTSGSAYIMGINVAADPMSVKQRIAVVPQQSNLDRSLRAAIMVYRARNEKLGLMPYSMNWAWVIVAKIWCCAIQVVWHSV